MLNKKRGIKNISIGLIAKALTLLIGIIIPRLVLVNLGSESNGLLNSVSNALTYMSLLEAGVGTASLQALYKPCGDRDKARISQIVNATDLFYRKTGVIYFICVIILSISYSMMINSSLSKWSIFTVVFLTGVSGVLSYLFQGKFKILLAAEGKNYVVTSVTTIINVGINVSKAILLVMGYDVVVIQASFFIFNILQTIIYLIYAKRHYSWIDKHERPDFRAIAQKNAVLVHQISSMIFSNTDVLILSFFTSLKEVSVYSLYALIYGLVSSVGETLYDSYRYALGQAFYNDKERFNRLFNTYEVFTLIISFSLFTICRGLISDFLRLYTAGINDVTYTDKYLPWLFAAYYILNNGRTSSNTVISIAQRFEETKWRAVFESTINVLVSLIAVSRVGIYGVLIGTIVALLYRTNDMIVYAARIMNRSVTTTYKRWLFNMCIFIIESSIISNCSYQCSDYFHLIVYACLLVIVTMPLYMLLNCIIDREYVEYGLRIIKNAIWE